MEASDRILLNNLIAGKQTAYEAVFKKYYKPLVLKAYLIIDNEMEAEDLVQDLFVAMWQKSQYISIKTSLKSYLFRAVNNQSLMCLRARKVEQRRLDAYTEAVTKAGDSELIIDLCNEQAINLALNGLSVKRQTAFKLVHLEDKKYKEAAVEMGVSVNSIKTHLKLAVKLLQEKLITFK
ncbi:RNA polymerase sigma factor [Pedobacter duraquae]|uniref:RNA polymerase sigma-70 factor (ECF subfamily) n=1 Tax=Pedobacter duraquae TaxID=425511 RepID=A0A4V3C306_9SPHI|nr:sigma-70 family RNA polymerase sigma factor [Pedobacter duraquae]TDO20239.1 RNA polymerase sigma-70 factor (ECF subfamily) [Pedobacter duraquae]